LYYVRNPNEKKYSIDVYREIFQNFLRVADKSDELNANDMKSKFGFNIYNSSDAALEASYRWSDESEKAFDHENSLISPCKGGVPDEGFPGRCGSSNNQYTSYKEFRGGVNWAIHQEGGACTLGTEIAAVPKRCTGPCVVFEKEGNDSPFAGNGVDKGPCTTLEQCRDECHGLSRYVVMYRNASTCSSASTFQCFCLAKLDWESKLSDEECSTTSNQIFSNEVLPPPGWNSGTYTFSSHTCAPTQTPGKLDGLYSQDTAICLVDSNSENWIQVDLGKLKRVYGLYVSGRPTGSGNGEYVKSFSVKARTSIAGEWSTVSCHSEWQDNGECKGNVDDSSIVSSWFNISIVSRYIRIFPVDHEENPSLRVVPIFTHSDFGGLTVLQGTDSCRGSGHLISGKSSVCTYEGDSPEFLFDLRTPTQNTSVVFGFRHMGKYNDRSGRVETFLVWASNDLVNWNAVKCSDTSVWDINQAYKCKGIATDDPTNAIITSLFYQPVEYRFVKLTPILCGSGGCSGSFALVFGSQYENDRGKVEANCAYPYGKSVDNFAMGGIERAAVYFGKCLAPNFNINAGDGYTNVGDVLGFLRSDSGASEQAWTTDKFDELEWTLKNNTFLKLDEENAMILLKNIEFDFLTPEMSFHVSVRDQHGLYGERSPKEPNSWEMFSFTANFPIGSGSVKVTHDLNLTDKNYEVKEFSVYNHHVPPEMNWADDNAVTGAQITYAMKLKSETWKVPILQTCDDQGIFCITECGGKIVVEKHSELNFESNTRKYVLDIRILQNQYIGGRVEPIVKAQGETIILVTDVNEPPALGEGIAFSIPEDTPTSNAPYKLNYSDPDNFPNAIAHDDVENIEIQALASVPSARTGLDWKIEKIITGGVPIWTLVPKLDNEKPWVSQNELDYETFPSYTISLKISDKAGAFSTGTIAVLIDDDNEAPVILEGLSISTRSIEEHARHGSGRIPPAIARSDEDDDATQCHLVTDEFDSDLFRWFGGIEGNVQGGVWVDDCRLEINNRTSSQTLDYELLKAAQNVENPYLTIKIVVRDNAHKHTSPGFESNLSKMSQSATFKVHVTDVNEPPKFNIDVVTSYSIGGDAYSTHFGILKWWQTWSKDFDASDPSLVEKVNSVVYKAARPLRIAWLPIPHENRFCNLTKTPVKITSTGGVQLSVNDVAIFRVGDAVVLEQCDDSANDGQEFLVRSISTNGGSNCTAQTCSSFQNGRQMFAIGTAVPISNAEVTSVEQCRAACENIPNVTGCHYNDDHDCSFTRYNPPQIVRYGNTYKESDKISFCGPQRKIIVANLVDLGSSVNSLSSCKAICEALPATHCQYKSAPANFCGYSTVPGDTAISIGGFAMDYTLKCTPHNNLEKIVQLMFSDGSVVSSSPGNCKIRLKCPGLVYGDLSSNIYSHEDTAVDLSTWRFVDVPAGTHFAFFGYSGYQIKLSEPSAVYNTSVAENSLKSNLQFNSKQLNSLTIQSELRDSEGITDASFSLISVAPRNSSMPSDSLEIANLHSALNGSSSADGVGEHNLPPLVSPIGLWTFYGSSTSSPDLLPNGKSLRRMSTVESSNYSVFIDLENNDCKVLYPVQHSSEENCLYEQQHITRETDCMLAVDTVMSAVWVEGQSVVNTTSRPYGCYLDGNDNKVYFNLNPHGVSFLNTYRICIDRALHVTRRCPMIGIGQGFTEYATGTENSNISFPPFTLPLNNIAVRFGDRFTPMKRSTAVARWAVGDSIDKMSITLLGSVNRFCQTTDNIEPFASFCIRKSGVEQFCVSDVFQETTYDISLIVSSGDYIDYVFTDHSEGNCKYALLKATIDSAITTFFSVDSGLGYLDIVTPLNFERASKYVIVVQATDGGGLSSQTVINVYVEDINEAPKIFLANAYHIPENVEATRLNSVTGDFGRCNSFIEHYLVVQDPDEIDHMYSESQIEVESSEPSIYRQYLDIVSRPKPYRFAYQFSVIAENSFDYEIITEITVEIKITDHGGLQTTGNLRVYVDDCNDPPTILSEQYIDAKEDAVEMDIVGTISASEEDPTDDLYFLISQQQQTNTSECSVPGDACVWRNSTEADANGNRDRFSVEKTGRTVANIRFIAAGNFSGKQLREWGQLSYRLTIHVYDKYRDKDPASGKVLIEDSARTPVVGYTYISVTAVNNPPMFVNCLAERRVDENTWDPVYRQNRVVTGTDADLEASDSPLQRISYEIYSGNDGGVFRLEHICNPECKARIYVQGNSSLDFEAMPSVQNFVSLIIYARDDGPGTKFSECTVKIYVDNRNERPSLLPDDGTLAIAENSAAGSVVSGTGVLVTDPDRNDTLIFVLVGECSEVDFYLESSASCSADNCMSIKLCPNVIINYEANSMPFALRVTVTDTGGLSSDGLFSIAVQDVNDPPTVEDMWVSIPENSPGGTAIGNVISHDEDGGQSLQFSVEGRSRTVASDDLFSCWTLTTNPSDHTMMIPFKLPTLNTIDVVLSVADVAPDVYAEVSFFGLAGYVCDQTNDNEIIEVLYTIRFTYTETNSSKRWVVKTTSCQPGWTDIEANAEVTSALDSFWVQLQSIEDEEHGSIRIGYGTEELDELNIAGVRAIREMGVSSTEGKTVSVCTISLGAIQDIKILNENEIFRVDPSTGDLFVRDHILGGDYGTLDFERNSGYGIMIKGRDSAVDFLEDFGFVFITLEDLNEPPLFRQNCPNDAYIACPTVNEVSNIVGNGLNGFPSYIQAYDFDDFGDDSISYNIISGNSLNSESAFFLVEPAVQNGVDFIEQRTLGLPHRPQGTFIGSFGTLVNVSDEQYCPLLSGSKACNGWTREQITNYEDAPAKFISSDERQQSIYVYEPDDQSKCDYITLTPRDEFAFHQRSIQYINHYVLHQSHIQQSGIFRVEAFARVSSSWIQQGDKMFHLSLLGSDGKVIEKVSGGFPQYRDQWELIYVDSPVTDQTVSHFVLHLGWPKQDGVSCAEHTEGRIEIYGLRVYLRGSLIDFRATNVKFDFETKDRFVLDISASDQAGATTVGKMLVTVIDVNEPPIFQDHNFEVDEQIKEDGLYVIADVNASDPDDSTDKTKRWGTESLVFRIESQTQNNVVANAFVEASSHFGTHHVRYIQTTSGTEVWRSRIGGSAEYIDIDFGRLVWVSSIEISFDGPQAAFEYVITKWENPPGDESIGMGTVYHARNKLCTSDRVDNINIPDELVYAFYFRFSFVQPCSGKIGLPSYGVKSIQIFEQEIFDIDPFAAGVARLHVREAPAAARLDYECLKSHVLKIIVADKHGKGFQVTATIYITVRNVNEDPLVGKNVSKIPLVRDNHRYVPEDSGISAKVGNPIMLFDPDLITREQLLFEFRNDNSFTIDECGGQIRVNHALDFEEHKTHNVTVLVKDGHLEVDELITVHVLDVNEPPQFGKIRDNLDDLEESAWIWEAARIRNEMGTLAVSNGMVRFRVSGSSVNFSPNQIVHVQGVQDVRFNGFFTVVTDPSPTNNSFYCNLTSLNIEEGSSSKYGTVSVWEAGSKMGDLYSHKNNDGSSSIYEVGRDMQAVDPDNSDDCRNTCKQRLRFSILADTDPSIFAIDPVLGTLQLQTWWLNYEHKSTYFVKVVVTDDGRIKTWGPGGEEMYNAEVQVVSFVKKDGHTECFHSSGNWTPPANVNKVNILVVGAGYDPRNGCGCG
jgi:hypothetical protein